MRQKIKKMLETLHPSDAIQLIESIGKELRRKNSVRINSGDKSLLDLDRPDLDSLKSKKK